MKAHTVSLINSLVLVTMGLWGYLDSDSRPITALIPVIVGIILLIINSCLLYTSPSPRDVEESRMPSSA